MSSTALFESLPQKTPNGKLEHAKKSNESFSAGYLTKLMNPLLQEWNEQPKLQWELKRLSTVLRVDRAHTVMLGEQRIITKYQAGVLLQELDNIEQAGPEGFKTEPGFGSIVLQIEQDLTRRVGEDTAGRLPIARSRLDQGPTVRRITDRDEVLVVMEELQCLQATLISKAKEHRDTKKVHYTHMQQSQAANFGHWLLAFKDRLEDSFLQSDGPKSSRGRRSIRDGPTNQLPPYGGISQLLFCLRQLETRSRQV